MAVRTLLPDSNWSRVIGLYFEQKRLLKFQFALAQAPPKAVERNTVPTQTFEGDPNVETLS